MSFLQIFLLSVGLAMDAAAVSVARGCAAGRSSHAGEVARVALLFGGAQALMPLLGWALGSQMSESMAAVDHWVAFGVLAFIGGKMLKDAGSKAPDEPEAPGFGWRILIGLAIATSIDAFAVGLTLPLLNAPLALSVVTIGVVTAMLSALGVMLGRRFGTLLGHKLDAFGGVVLILLGVKILVEHLTQAS
jgi:putative Mn2+ efflux pump MntP